jgi:hypothetical protein
MSQLLPLEARVKVSDEVVIRENKDGTVIAMKMDDGDLFYKIDGAAAKIFRDLRKNIAFTDAVDEVASFFKIEKKIVHEDASAFLLKLENLGFVSIDR